MRLWTDGNKASIADALQYSAQSRPVEDPGNLNRLRKTQAPGSQRLAPHWTKLRQSMLTSTWMPVCSWIPCWICSLDLALLNAERSQEGLDRVPSVLSSLASTASALKTI